MIHYFLRWLNTGAGQLFNSIGPGGGLVSFCGFYYAYKIDKRQRKLETNELIQTKHMADLLERIYKIDLMQGSSLIEDDQELPKG